MVSLIDILHKIGWERLSAPIEAKNMDLNVCITNDVEGSEAEFLNRYGEGTTYYFKLDSYHHGRKLALALYQRLKGYIVDFPDYLFSKSHLNGHLYFFVHVRELVESE